MTNGEHPDRLIDDLRAARPALRPSAQDWAKGDGGQRVLEGVLANAETAAPAPSARTAGPRGAAGPERAARWAWSGQGYRTALAVTALVLLGAALSLGLSLGLGRAGSDPGSAESTTAESTTAATTAAVTKLSAVQDVMQLVFTVISWSAESVGSSTTVEALLLSTAVDLGLITTSELTAASAAGPLLEGQYAVLLWKAFGHFFPVSAVPTSPVATGLHAQQAEAIQELQRVGVIRESDGPFTPDRPLDSRRERLLLDRMEAALRGAVSH